jgi:hypothetical protein
MIMPALELAARQPLIEDPIQQGLKQRPAGLAPLDCLSLKIQYNKD